MVSIQLQMLNQIQKTLDNLIWIFFSLFIKFIFWDSNRNTPNITTIIPAIEFKSPKNWVIELDKILLIKTPKVEKTTENPNTKNIVFAIMLTLLIWKLLFWSCFISFNVVPEICAKKAGIIGKMHGAINDPRPAENAISTVGSAIC